MLLLGHALLEDDSLLLGLDLILLLLLLTQLLMIHVAIAKF